MESDTVFGIAAIYQFFAHFIQIRITLYTCRIDSRFFEHICVVIYSGIAVADGVTDLVAFVVAISAADGIPGIL